MQIQNKEDKDTQIHKHGLEAGFQHADFSARADFFGCADFSAYLYRNFHHNADC